MTQLLVGVCGGREAQGSLKVSAAMWGIAGGEHEAACLDKDIKACAYMGVPGFPRKDPGHFH